MFALIPQNNQKPTNNHMGPRNSKELFGMRNEFIRVMDNERSKEIKNLEEAEWIQSIEKHDRNTSKHIINHSKYK